MAERSLSHYALFSWTDAFWELGSEMRKEVQQQWLTGLREAAERVDLYQVFPARADTDLLVWSVVPADEECSAVQFFTRFALATTPILRFVRPALTLWGYTRPSAYAKGQSAQEINPFADEHKAYLVIYPFVKTVAWYLMSKDTRQGMMNEHIRIGHQYPEIKQLLLYSFGLQDQEFVVVYETDNLVRFSDLVNELRGADGRGFTERDTPIFTAIYHPAEETLGLWG